MRGSQIDPEQDGQNMQDTVAPAKPYEELSIEEKIERIHEVVKQLMLTVSDYYSRTERLMNLLEQHVHDEKGKSIIKKELRQEYYSGRGLGGVEKAASTERRYF